ncbi:MAG: hypothetical protein WBX95_05430 [Xanthobacteraceae bacterium]
MIGDNMGLVLSPATQHAGVATGIWVCIDAPAMELIAMQLSVKSMTWHLQTDHYGLDHPLTKTIQRNSQSSYE